MRWMTTVFLSLILLFLLSYRVDIGLHRFFDADEFTHVSLAVQVLHGQKPYLDFMTFFTPAFSWFLDILLQFSRSASEVFLIARMVSVGVFFALLSLLSALFGMMRGWRYALLPAIILAFLPLPYDKFTEIRPDTLSALFGFAGIFFFVCAAGRKKSEIFWFLSGISYSLSVVLLQKSVPFLAAGFIFGIAYSFHEYTKQTQICSRAFQCKHLMRFFSASWRMQTAVRWVYQLKCVRQKEFFWFIGGIGTPFVLFFSWVVFVIKDIDLVYYSLTTLALEVNNMSRYYSMEPHLYFFPTGQFYGGDGITIGLLFNHALWTLGILTGAVRLFTPNLTPNAAKSRVFAEGLLSVLFFVLIYLYMYYVPLKHPQYLIPIAVCIAFYASDALVLLFNVLERRIGSIGIGIAVVCFGIGFARVTISAQEAKKTWTNSGQMSELARLEKEIPSDSSVVDLEGRLFNRPSAYPLCCLPFGAFEGYISRRPPLLRAVLDEKKVRYIFQGGTNRISVLSSEDQGYITSHYESVDGFKGGLLMRKE